MRQQIAVLVLVFCRSNRLNRRTHFCTIFADNVRSRPDQAAAAVVPGRAQKTLLEENNPVAARVKEVVCVCVRPCGCQPLSEWVTSFVRWSDHQTILRKHFVFVKWFFFNVQMTKEVLHLFIDNLRNEAFSPCRVSIFDDERQIIICELFIH